jgi:hypothetical protein
MPTNISDMMRPAEPNEPSDADAIKSAPALTFGEKLVGLSFNPSKDSDVDTAKRLCAQLADLVHSKFDRAEQTEVSRHLYSHTIGEILNAQMNVVKLLTLKY